MPADPTRPDGYAMDRNHLHIWPRHNFMLIGLPNKVSQRLWMTGCSPGCQVARSRLMVSSGWLIHVDAVRPLHVPRDDTDEGRSGYILQRQFPDSSCYRWGEAVTGRL